MGWESSQQLVAALIADDANPCTVQLSISVIMGKRTGVKEHLHVQVWCGHEYTIKNLEFAADADKENRAVQDKLQWAKSQRAADQPTIPSTIGVSAHKQPIPSLILPAYIPFWQLQCSVKEDVRRPAICQCACPAHYARSAAVWVSQGTGCLGNT